MLYVRGNIQEKYLSSLTSKQTRRTSLAATAACRAISSVHSPRRHNNNNNNNNKKTVARNPWCLKNNRSIKSGSFSFFVFFFLLLFPTPTSPPHHHGSSSRVDSAAAAWLLLLLAFSLPVVCLIRKVRNFRAIVCVLPRAVTIVTSVDSPFYIFFSFFAFPLTLFYYYYYYFFFLHTALCASVHAEESKNRVREGGDRQCVGEAYPRERMRERKKRVTGPKCS